jgi:hypothetical protein
MRRTREDWRRVVYRSKAITDSTRTLLLYLADHMRADRTVSVPRSQIAEALGRNERRVAERFQAAVEAGFLSSVAPGQPGRTAIYQGIFPDLAKGADSSTHKGADGRTPWRPDKGADGGPATTRAKLTVVGRDRNGGSDNRPGVWSSLRLSAPRAVAA